jgi:hypothetical protein
VVQKEQLFYQVWEAGGCNIHEQSCDSGGEYEEIQQSVKINLIIYKKKKQFPHEKDFQKQLMPSPWRISSPRL